MSDEYCEDCRPVVFDRYGDGKDTRVDGVALCPLHAAAQAMRDVLTRIANERPCEHMVRAFSPIAAARQLLTAVWGYYASDEQPSLTEAMAAARAAQAAEIDDAEFALLLTRINDRYGEGATREALLGYARQAYRLGVAAQAARARAPREEP